MVDSFEQSVRVFGIALKISFGPIGPLSIWKCERLNAEFWMKFEIKVSYSYICIL
jgi:hypothetical protein